MNVKEMEKYVEHWVQWGKSNELMKARDILQHIIECEKAYCGNTLSESIVDEATTNLHNFRSCLTCLGKALQNKKFWYKNMPKKEQPSGDSMWLTTEKYYFAKPTVPPWMKKKQNEAKQ